MLLVGGMGVGQNTHSYLHKPPSFHYEGVLKSVDNEPVDLLVGSYRRLAQLLHDSRGTVHDSLIGPRGRDYLNEWDVVRGVDLKRGTQLEMARVYNTLGLGMRKFASCLDKHYQRAISLSPMEAVRGNNYINLQIR